jgi:hypothetical protein
MFLRLFSRKPKYRSGSDVARGRRVGALCSERMHRLPVAGIWVRRHVPGLGAQQHLVQTLVNRFRQFRHGCLFQQIAEPVNTDSSHRSYQRAIILMTGLVLASLCRQDGEKTGQVKKGECHMDAEDPQRTSLKQRASNELVKFAVASLAPPAQVERQSCHP